MLSHITTTRRKKITHHCFFLYPLSLTFYVSVPLKLAFNSPRYTVCSRCCFASHLPNVSGLFLLADRSAAAPQKSAKLNTEDHPKKTHRQRESQPGSKVSGWRGTDSSRVRFTYSKSDLRFKYMRAYIWDDTYWVLSFFFWFSKFKIPVECVWLKCSIWEPDITSLMYKQHHS